MGWSDRVVQCHGSGVEAPQPSVQVGGPSTGRLGRRPTGADGALPCVQAIVGMNLFGWIKLQGNLTIDANFRDFPTAMLLLFRWVAMAGRHPWQPQDPAMAGTGHPGVPATP